MGGTEQGEHKKILKEIRMEIRQIMKTQESFNRFLDESTIYHEHVWRSRPHHHHGKSRSDLRHTPHFGADPSFTIPTGYFTFSKVYAKGKRRVELRLHIHHHHYFKIVQEDGWSILIKESNGGHTKYDLFYEENHPAHLSLEHESFTDFVTSKLPFKEDLFYVPARHRKED